MIDLLIQDVRPAFDGAIAVSGSLGSLDLQIDAGRVVAISPHDRKSAAARQVIDARGSLVCPPYVEPHVHLDTCLTAGQPRWNESGTLWEGIARWAERKPSLTREDVIARVEEVLRWYVANGVLHVRSHVDITDARLVALEAMLEVRDRVRDVVNLQIVAFPQEGICSYPDGEALLAEAVRRGVDVVGAIPHFEDTREDGVQSLRVAVDLADSRNLRVDVHCDEIDDEQSRFVEVLATYAHRAGLSDRVTASHTTAMGSYGPAYSYKLQRIISRSGINLVCNPAVNLHLQGRFDGYPKRRGLTQVKEMLAAGVNVAFGGDDIMDPWYPMGTANPAQTAYVGTHATQMTAPREIAECFRMVTDRAAKVLGVTDTYPLQVGGRADLMVLPARDPFDVIRRQVTPSHVVAKGRVVASTPPRQTQLTWPGREAEVTDLARLSDSA